MSSDPPLSEKSDNEQSIEEESDETDDEKSQELFNLFKKAFFGDPQKAGNSNGEIVGNHALDIKDVFDVDKILEGFANFSSNHRGRNKHSENKESGWDFWGRVYDDPALRSQMDERYRNAPTVSQMLKNEKLIRAQVMFYNVPPLVSSSRQIVRTLIQSECGSDLAIFDIYVSSRRWRIRFYRCEDALVVFQAFKGYRFQNRILSVQFEDFTITRREIPVPRKVIDSVHQPCKPRPRNKLKPPITNLWSAAERSQIDLFKNELLILLEKTGMTNPGIRIDDPHIMELCPPDSGLIEEILKQWPVGLFRMCAPEVRLTGRYLSLSDKCQNAVLSKVDRESYPRVYVEDWEPIAPSHIRTNYHFLDYSCALLRHFGPQEFYVGLPWRILTALLGNEWPKDAIALMKSVVNLSPRTCIFGSTLYLVSDESHRTSIAEKINELPE